ncbi:DUF7848 domain-containing protein [Streptomyces sp. NBC_01751]|uniref:DUF7848 domain-containing protein n=1 Tax=Streptomyces sp. NBC_01751 TaxID=2975929 RepID=UPI003FA3BC0C
MSPRTVLRFVDYVATQDTTAEVLFSATCVTGDDADCGAKSGLRGSLDDLTRWMGEHCRDTGHTRFTRAYADYATVEPRP